MPVSLSSNLPALQMRMVEKAHLGVYKAAHDVEAHAIAVVPIDTGHLMGGITVIPQGALQAEVDANAEYAEYVEFGTHKMAAQPYMVPAAEAVRPAFIAAMSQIV